MRYAAIDGDDAQEFGFKIFDLSENGCNLRVKVEKNEGGYPSYTSSKFVSPSKIEGLEDLDDVYGSVKSLDTIFQRKSYDEIKEILNYHFLGKDEEKSEKQVASEDFEVETEVSPSSSNTASDDDDDSEEVLSEQEKKMQEILKNL